MQNHSQGLAIVFTAMFMLGNDVLQVNNLVPPSRLRRVRIAIADGVALHLEWQNRSLQFSDWIPLCVLNIELLDSFGYLDLLRLLPWISSLSSFLIIPL
jgi:hypothetical protein